MRTTARVDVISGLGHKYFPPAYAFSTLLPVILARALLGCFFVAAERLICSTISGRIKGAARFKNAIVQPATVVEVIVLRTCLPEAR